MNQETLELLSKDQYTIWAQKGMLVWNMKVMWSKTYIKPLFIGCEISFCSFASILIFHSCLSPFSVTLSFSLSLSHLSANLFSSANTPVSTSIGLTAAELTCLSLRYRDVRWESNTAVTKIRTQFTFISTIVQKFGVRKNYYFFFFLKKRILLFHKDTFNWSKVTTYWLYDVKKVFYFK